jgi:hypothetical protein
MKCWIQWEKSGAGTRIAIVQNELKFSMKKSSLKGRKSPNSTSSANSSSRPVENSELDGPATASTKPKRLAWVEDTIP